VVDGEPDQQARREGGVPDVVPHKRASEDEIDLDAASSSNEAAIATARKLSRGWGTSRGS